MKSFISKTLEISCIICHHKGEFIYSCVESIKNSVGVSFEIIIVTSDSYLYKKGIKGCRIIFDKGLPAQKRNIGVDVSYGRYIAFFDDDVEISDDCLYELKEGLKLPEAGMVYGKLWNMEHRDRFDEAGGYLTWTGFIWSRAQQNDIDTGQFNKEEEILSGKSASCMIGKMDFLWEGQFDESFGILGEETDLAWRVWLDGKKVYFIPKATGYHAFNTKYKPAKDYYTSNRVHFNGCRNYLTMLIKNLGKEHLWIIPIHSLIWFGVGFAMLVTGKIRQGWNIWRGLGYVIRNLAKILKKRSQIQASRKVKDETIWHSIYRVPSGRYFWTRFRKYLSTGLHGYSSNKWTLVSDVPQRPLCP